MKDISNTILNIVLTVAISLSVVAIIVLDYETVKQTQKEELQETQEPSNLPEYIWRVNILQKKEVISVLEGTYLITTQVWLDRNNKPYTVEYSEIDIISNDNENNPIKERRMAEALKVKEALEKKLNIK